MWEGVWLDPEWYADLDRHYSIYAGLVEYCRSHAIGLKYDGRIRRGGQIGGLVIELNPDNIEQAVWYLIHELVHFESGHYDYQTEEELARNELHTAITEMIIRDELAIIGDGTIPMNFDLMLNIPEIGRPVKLLLEKIAKYDGGLKKR